MAQKIFVVLERGYEYNDETYDSSESGNSIKAFTDEAAADAEALRLSMKFARETPEKL